jgi:serine phosphatase RsbU (regulator of sigma subunit)
LCVCSDGVIESGIDSGEEFGASRLISTLRASRHHKIENIVLRIIGGARKHSFGEISDDMTVIGIQAA